MNQTIESMYASISPEEQAGFNDFVAELEAQHDEIFLRQMADEN